MQLSTTKRSIITRAMSELKTQCATATTGAWERSPRMEACLKRTASLGRLVLNCRILPRGPGKPRSAHTPREGPTNSRPGVRCFTAHDGEHNKSKTHIAPAIVRLSVPLHDGDRRDGLRAAPSIIFSSKHVQSLAAGALSRCMHQIPTFSRPSQHPRILHKTRPCDVAGVRRPPSSTSISLAAISYKFQTGTASTPSSSPSDPHLRSAT